MYSIIDIRKCNESITEVASRCSSSLLWDFLLLFRMNVWCCVNGVYCSDCLCQLAVLCWSAPPRGDRNGAPSTRASCIMHRADRHTVVRSGVRMHVLSHTQYNKASNIQQHPTHSKKCEILVKRLFKMLNDSNQVRNHLSKIELTLYFGLGTRRRYGTVL